MPPVSSQSDLYVKSAASTAPAATGAAGLAASGTGEDMATSSLAKDLNQLFKLRITVMVGVMTAIGLFLRLDEFSLAAHDWLLFITMIGAMLSCMGASVFNQIIEIEIDRRMHRTSQRPLVIGSVSVATAWKFAWLFSLTGVGLLLWLVNWQAALISGFTVASYALIYTPLKQKTSLATIVGAVPGALPPVIGYMAVADPVFDIRIGLMFAIMFLWQLPHFLAIAWLYRADYASANLPVLPVVDQSGNSTFRQMLLGCFALLPLGLLPAMMGMTGMLYFVGAFVAGLMFLLSAIWLIRKQTESAARLCFYVSLIYLPAIFFLFVIDKV